MRRLALFRFRNSSFITAFGFDLLAPTPPREQATVMVELSVFFFRDCYPANVPGWVGACACACAHTFSCVQ